MARTKRSRRSYGAGEWGRNRIRVFPDPKTGMYQIEWRENGRRLTRSLKHRDWRRAKRQADEFAAGFARQEPNGKAEPLTLGRRIPKGLNHGRKSHKVIQDCTICVSCRCAESRWTVRRKREKRYWMAGTQRPP